MKDERPADMESATARGRGAVEILTRAGERLGYRSETEYPVQGGRIDVVWLTELPAPFDADPVAVAAFEIESSWRTRKHLKGDYLNLFDLGAARGVLVLLGDGADVESTRTFAAVLVQRPGPNIVVWDGDDIDRLAAAVAAGGEDASGPATNDMVEIKGPSTNMSARHVGKYRDLWQWLVGRSEAELSLSFDEIEEVIGMPLPPSCRRHAAH